MNYVWEMVPTSFSDPVTIYTTWTTEEPDPEDDVLSDEGLEAPDDPPSPKNDPVPEEE